MLQVPLGDVKTEPPLTPEEREARRPSRCFRINSEAKARKGLKVSLDKEGEPAVVIGTGRNPVEVPLSEEHKDLIEDAGWRHVYQITPFYFVDITRDSGRLQVVAPLAEKYDWAIVHVEVSPGINGRMIYTASSFGEDIAENRVKRAYKEFPPIGIEKLAEGGMEPELLIRMMPGSSFRLICTGDTGGAPDGMTVIWTGKNMLVHPRFRRRRKRG